MHWYPPLTITLTLQVICSDRGRPGTFPSWGRRKRAVFQSVGAPRPPAVALPLRKINATAGFVPVQQARKSADPPKNFTTVNATDDDAEQVRELLHVYLSRADIPHEGPSAREFPG